MSAKFRHSNAPTLDELRDFTLDSYVKLLRYLDQIYEIVPFCRLPGRDGPYLILRHDIDISLPAALKMAQIERDLSIKSTYFVLLSSGFYNILEGNNVDILKQISKLGHEIGLHYYPAQYRLYNQNLMKTLNIETQLLEQLLGKKICSIARHGPWERDPFAGIKKYINANHPYLREDLFIHESDRAWTPLQGLINLLNNPPKRVQLLTHPENWQEDKIDRITLLERHFQALKKKNLLLKKQVLEYLQTEQLVVNYDNMIKRDGTEQPHIPEHKSDAKKQNKLRQALDHYNSLFRYYLINTTFGWNVHQIKTTTQKTLKNSENRHHFKWKEDPLVSVIITSYNYGRYLTDAIESVLKQTYQNIEIIVVDDGSTDNTKNIAKRYPVQYFCQTNQGVAIARNNGIKLSHGEFFICLDADDKLAPEHIRETIRLMMKDLNIGFVLTGSKIWNEEMKTENIWIPRKIYHKYSLFAGWRGFPGCALVRRIAFDSLECGFDSVLPAYEDLDVCFRLLLKGWKTKTILEPLHWYRIHKSSLNPKTPQQRKYAESFINRKYWFRKTYRKLSVLYENTLGRTTSLIVHPIEYLKGIKKKIKIKVWMRSHNWVNSINQEKAQELTQEFFFTVDLLVEWCQNKELRNYYIKQLKIFESQLLNIISSDARKRNFSINRNEPGRNFKLIS